MPDGSYHGDYSWRRYPARFDVDEAPDKNGPFFISILSALMTGVVVTRVISGAVIDTLHNHPLMAVYSDLSARTVVMRAARSAGYMPAPTPIHVANPNASKASSTGMTTSDPPSSEIEIVTFIKLIVSDEPVEPSKAVFTRY